MTITFQQDCGIIQFLSKGPKLTVYAVDLLPN